MSSPSISSDSNTPPQPVQIINFEKRRGRNAKGEILTINSKAIADITKKAGQLPAVIMAVTGEHQSGKSLFANLLLRNLAIGKIDQKKIDELQQNELIPDGFLSKLNSRSRGIYMWDHPFIFETEEKRLGIFLIDTAGSALCTNDLEKLVGFSTIVASSLFYNVQANKHKKISLDSVSLLSKIVGQYTGQGEYKGQRLNFVIRDIVENIRFPNLQSWLCDHFEIIEQLPSPSSLQKESEAETDGREKIYGIKQCFDESTFAVLQYPFEKKSTKLNPAFAKEFSEFLKNTLKEIPIKHILGTEIPASCIVKLFEEAVKLVNDSEAMSQSLSFAISKLQKSIVQPTLVDSAPLCFQLELEQFVGESKFGFRKIEELQLYQESFLHNFWEEHWAVLNFAGKQAIKVKIQKIFQDFSDNSSRIMKELSLIPDWQEFFYESFIQFNAVLLDEFYGRPIPAKRAQQMAAEILVTFKGLLGELAPNAYGSLARALENHMETLYKDLHKKTTQMRSEQDAETKLRDEILGKFLADLLQKAHSSEDQFCFPEDLEAVKNEHVASIPTAQLKSADLKTENFDKLFQIVKNRNKKNPPVLGILVEGNRITNLVIKVVAFYASNKIFRVSFHEGFGKVFNSDSAKRIIQSVEKKLECDITGIMLTVPTKFLQNSADFLTVLGGDSRRLFLTDKIDALVMTGFVKLDTTYSRMCFAIILIENEDESIDVEFRRMANGVMGPGVFRRNGLSTVPELASGLASNPALASGAGSASASHIENTLFEIRAAAGRYLFKELGVFFFIHCNEDGLGNPTTSSNTFNYFEQHLLPLVGMEIHQSDIPVGLACLGEKFRRHSAHAHLSLQLTTTPPTFQVTNMDLRTAAQNTP